jgi:hypothetical protein
MPAPVEHVIRTAGRLLEAERLLEQPDDVRRQTADLFHDFDVERGAGVDREQRRRQEHDGEKPSHVSRR